MAEFWLKLDSTRKFVDGAAEKRIPRMPQIPFSRKPEADKPTSGCRMDATVRADVLSRPGEQSSQNY